MVNLDELRDLLTMLKSYPEVKRFKVQEMEIELDHAPIVQETETVETIKLPIDTGMPPDNVMLYASTPTFDEMVEENSDGH